MSSLLSYVPVVNRLAGSGSGSKAINLPSVEIHHVETDSERRARCLKHLLKANHVNYSVVYHNLQFDNHNPHILSSAYLFGANEVQLNAIYEAEAKVLDPWKPSPAEVSDLDWRDFLGDKHYQRAYLDFFEDKLAMDFAYDWKKVVEHFLFSGKSPLFHGLIGGLGHPLIHLGYAYEMDSKDIGMEALTLGAVQYDFFHKYLDNGSYTKASSLASSSPLELLVKMSEDKRFDSLPKNPSFSDLESIFDQHEALIMEYWNGWKIDNPLKQFELSQEAAVALLVTTVRPGTHAYNFVLVHLLTSSHAVRILLPFFPTQHHVTLVREWWLFVIAVFILKGRPTPDPDNVDKDLKGKHWKHVEDRALNSPWAKDAHYVKALRAMREAARTWGDVHERYLQAATRRSDATSRIESVWKANYTNAATALMAPPAKRRRRNAGDASDNEDEQPRTTNNTLANFLVSSPSSPTKTRTPTASPSPVKTKLSTRRSSTSTSNRLPSRPQAQNSTSPSPKKTRGLGNGNGNEKGKSADLKTLFSKQAQRASRPGQGNDRRSTPVDDLISDPISEEDEISDLKTSSSSLVGQHARKRARNGTQAIAENGGPTTSQRFLKPPKPATPDGLNDDQRPWSERFGPRNLDELVVHKKKVSDVRRWLEDVMAGRMRQRLLILKGPAGSAKTTTLRLLANDMGCEVLEWKNPSNNAATGFVSTSAKFDEFLGRGGKFGALDMDDVPSSTLSSSSNGATTNDTKRLMLIEEFPNTFSRSSSALTSFRNSILQYLASHTPSLSVFSQQLRREPVKPLVMIISETLLTTTSASADSFTAHRLLGPEILRHPGVGVIEFNAVAPTLLAKALELIVQKEARKSGRRKTPGPLVLQRLGEIGDIRNAISSLEFLCLKGDQEADWGAKVAFTKQKKGVRDGIALTKGESDSLELISQREASLGIFHAVGKVVYNKRDEVASNDGVENLPSYLSNFSRPKHSQVSVDSLIDETGTDTHTFISALHENYAPSCESTDPMDLSTPIDYINDCIEALSLSDLLGGSSDIFFGGRGGFSGKDSGSHILRQDEITFQVAVRGLLFSLPNPVRRKMPTGAKGGDAYKMFYPQSLKLWRAKEEIEGLVDMWSTKILKGEGHGPTKNLTDGATAFRKPQQSTGETSWMQRQQQSRLMAVKSADPQEKDEETAPLLSLGSAARREMLLERLPYMAHIARGNGKSSIRLRDLDKVVSFRGVMAPNDESDAEDDQGTGEDWATDKPSEEASPRKKSAGVKAGAMTGMLAQKLVLSDDDIED